MKGLMMSFALMLTSLLFAVSVIWLGSYWYLHDLITHANKRAMLSTVRAWQLAGSWSLQEIADSYQSNLVIPVSVNYRAEVMGYISEPRALRIRLITDLTGKEIVSDETVIEEEQHEK
jgi:hypothetical protein